jgi:F-type H+-transporting ATPase subunit gamma
MANIRLIRRRIHGIQSIAKITRAMEMIATSKMRRAQEAGTAGRPYDQKIRQVISDLAAMPQTGESHPLLQRREVKKITIVHISPDRGLCGGLIANLNRKIADFVLGQKTPVTLVSIGRKGIDFMRRYGREIRAEFTQLGDRPSLLDTLPISRVIIDDYTSGYVDEVYVAYTRFVSTIVQTPVMEKLLPIEPPMSTQTKSSNFDYEPASEDVLGALLLRFVEMEIYHAILESIASEQSARMVAMRSATDNAAELVQDLTQMYNKARQEAITTKLLDIIGGATARSRN